MPHGSRGDAGGVWGAAPPFGGGSSPLFVLVLVPPILLVTEFELLAVIDLLVRSWGHRGGGMWAGVPRLPQSPPRPPRPPYRPSPRRSPGPAHRTPAAHPGAGRGAATGETPPGVGLRPHGDPPAAGTCGDPKAPGLQRRGGLGSPQKDWGGWGPPQSGNQGRGKVWGQLSERNWGERGIRGPCQSFGGFGVTLNVRTVGK